MLEVAIGRGKQPIASKPCKGQGTNFTETEFSEVRHRPGPIGPGSLVRGCSYRQVLCAGVCGHKVASPYAASVGTRSGTRSGTTVDISCPQIASCRWSAQRATL